MLPNLCTQQTVAEALEATVSVLPSSTSGSGYDFSLTVAEALPVAEALEATGSLLPSSTSGSGYDYSLTVAEALVGG